MVKKETPEWYLFRDVFLLYSDFSEPDDSDKFWKEFHDKIIETDKQYQDTDIAAVARKMFLAVYEAVEIKAKI